MLLTHTTPLEDIRNGLFFETREEFARRIGVTTQTYRRLLERDPGIENPTKRGIATALQVPPHLIAELLPAPTPERIETITAAIDEANASGGWWEVLDDGTFIPAPDVSCPPAGDVQGG